MEDYNEYLEENEYVVEELETQNSNLNLEEKSLAKNYFVEYLCIKIFRSRIFILW